MPKGLNHRANPITPSPPKAVARREVVEVWAIDSTMVGPSHFDRFIPWLTVSEQERLQGFRHPLAQRNFLVGRSCLRHLLSQRLGRSPTDLDFAYGRHGKPALSPASSLRFNLSHSGDWVAIALASHCELGIDVEQVRPLFNLPGLCDRCLTPVETATLQALTPDQAECRFHRYWTCKEAYAKGLGLGLAAPFTEIALDLGPKLPAATPTPITPLQGITEGWQVYQWQLAPGYLAALAVGLESDQPPSITLQHTTPETLLTGN